MAKPTLTVRTAHGTITRTTARTYAFVTCARGYRHDYLRAKAAADLKSYRENLKYHAEIVAELERGINRYPHTPNSVEQERARLDSCQAFVDGGWQVDLDARLAQSDADVAADFPRTDGAWSSRLDLARREAERLAQYHRDVRVFDVATGAEVLRLGEVL